MNFLQQLNATQAILDCIEREAPRNEKGVLELPYLKWSQQLREDIARGEAWLKNTSNPKEEKHAHDQSNEADQG